jgi:hypothetical protein
MRNKHYEDDDATFNADAYRVKGHAGIAWHAWGWQTEPDEDTEWSGCENRTGKVVCVMVGDDRQFFFDLDELEPITSDEFCPSCGQIGCGWH